jgi:hypothetical protein
MKKGKSMHQVNNKHITLEIKYYYMFVYEGKDNTTVMWFNIEVVGRIYS